MKVLLNPGCIALAALTSTAFAAAPVITVPDPLPDGEYGVAYSQNIDISPVPQEVRFPALPQGLTFGPGSTSTTYTLSGTPTQTGTFNLVFTARSFDGDTAQVTRQLVIEPPDDSEAPTVEITSMTVNPLPGENLYQFFFTFSADDNLDVAHLEYRGGVGHGPLDDWKYYPYLPGEPMEIILHCTAFKFEVRAVDVAGNRSAAANRKFEAPSTTPKFTTKGGSLPPASGKVGKKLVYKISASGASGFTATGLPPGCKLNKKTGVIKGVPKKAGTYSVKVTAQSSGGQSKTKLKIKVTE